MLYLSFNNRIISRWCGVSKYPCRSLLPAPSPVYIYRAAPTDDEPCGVMTPRDHINFFDIRKPSSPLGQYANAHTDLVTKVGK